METVGESGLRKPKIPMFRHPWGQPFPVQLYHVDNIMSMIGDVYPYNIILIISKTGNILR
jgi:hypothetical protein